MKYSKQVGRNYFKIQLEMNQDEPFFHEVPGTIWEIEPREDEWYFTRRYGEYILENRRNIIGKSLFEIFPKGHPVAEKILKGIQSKKYFIFIESITSGRFYQNCCKPILDDCGNIERVIGIFILNDKIHLPSKPEGLVGDEFCPAYKLRSILIS
jgi:hypothetical protein